MVPFNAGIKQEPGTQEVVEDGVVEVKSVVSTPQTPGTIVINLPKKHWKKGVVKLFFSPVYF